MPNFLIIKLNLFIRNIFIVSKVSEDCKSEGVDMHCWAPNERKQNEETFHLFKVI